MNHHEYAKTRIDSIVKTVINFPSMPYLKIMLQKELELAFLAGEATALEKELERMRGRKE